MISSIAVGSPIRGHGEIAPRSFCPPTPPWTCRSDHPDDPAGMHEEPGGEAASVVTDVLDRPSAQLTRSGRQATGPSTDSPDRRLRPARSGPPDRAWGRRLVDEPDPPTAGAAHP